MARNWIGEYGPFFSFLIHMRNFSFLFQLLFPPFVRQMVHCEYVMNRFEIFIHSKNGKWWMCAKNVIIGNVCALHIELSLFHFLSPLIILSHPFQTRRHTQISILCTLVVSVLASIICVCRSSFLPYWFLLIHLSFPLTIVYLSPPHSMEWRGLDEDATSCSFWFVATIILITLRNHLYPPPSPRTDFLS